MVEKMNEIPNDITPLCFLCFDVLQSTLLTTNSTYEFPNEFKGISCPLFVTWTKGESHDLRGCIGTFASESLEVNLPKYSLISALKDRRFSPISKQEVALLQVSVSLLINFEEGKGAMDWEIGKNGIKLFYKEYSATYLPEVAKENNWDKHKTLKNLLKKSGCKSELDQIIDQITLTSYESIKATITYNDFVNKI